jgi:hypothetical protein
MTRDLVESSWSNVRTLWTEAFRTSFHFAVASVRPDGSPHVTPIGSVLLCRSPGAPSTSRSSRGDCRTTSSATRG